MEKYKQSRKEVGNKVFRKRSKKGRKNLGMNYSKEYRQNLG